MEDTRRRIAQATFELHGLIGPAKTTIAAIAERAGVERATVYRHFPDDLALFRGCVGHGVAAHPFPDLTQLRSGDDPEKRLRAGLTRLYAYYRETEGIWPNILRDMPDLPVFQQANAEAGVFAYFAEVGAVLSEGWRITGRNRSSRTALLRAAVGHATEFQTWHGLVRGQGLEDRQVVEMMTVMVRCLAE
jgi:AcrR family transcriptional regulator